jgi:uncharacterized protein (DUF2147 family)
MAGLAGDALGLWRTESTDQGHLEVRVAPCDGGALCGTIMRARDAQGQEQAYPHTGRQMIWAMSPDGSGGWTGGRIWDPRNDRTFNSRMEAQGDTLVVAGCVLGLCQRQQWQRVSD